MTIGTLYRLGAVILPLIAATPAIAEDLQYRLQLTNTLGSETVLPDGSFPVGIQLDNVSTAPLRVSRYLPQKCAASISAAGTGTPVSSFMEPAILPTDGPVLPAVDEMIAAGDSMMLCTYRLTVLSPSDGREFTQSRIIELTNPPEGTINYGVAKLGPGQYRIVLRADNVSIDGQPLSHQALSSLEFSVLAR